MFASFSPGPDRKSTRLNSSHVRTLPTLRSSYLARIGDSVRARLAQIAVVSGGIALREAARFGRRRVGRSRRPGQQRLDAAGRDHAPVIEIAGDVRVLLAGARSEEHTSELQSRPHSPYTTLFLSSADR